MEWTSAAIEQETRRNFFRNLYTGHIPDRANELLETYGICPFSRYLILILDTYQKMAMTGMTVRSRLTVWL